MASVSGFAGLLGALSGLAELGRMDAQHGTLERTAGQLGQDVEDNAKARLGHYQTGWAPLTAATQAERAREGYAPDDPLLRSGQMQRDLAHHLEYDTDGVSVIVGIPADAPSAAYAPAQELGSLQHGVPPRPFLVPAAQEVAPTIRKRMAGLVKVAITKPGAFAAEQEQAAFDQFYGPDY